MSGRKRTRRPHSDLYREKWLNGAPEITTARRNAQMLARFVRTVSKGEPVDARDLQKIAFGFFSVLMGARWESEFPLPGREDPLRPNGERDADVWILVWKLVNVDDVPVTEALQTAAARHNVSFGNARAIYYRGEQLSKKTPHSSGKTSRKKRTK